MMSCRTSLSYLVSAIVIVMAKLLHSPTHAYALSDWELVRPKFRLIDALAEKAQVKEIQRMRGFCAELEQRGEIALAMAYPDQRGPSEPETHAGSLETVNSHQLYDLQSSQADFAQDFDFGEISFGEMFDEPETVPFIGVSTGVSGGNVWSEDDPTAARFNHLNGADDVYHS